MSVELDRLNCNAEVKLPLFTASLQPIKLKGGGDVYLALYMKYDQPLKKTAYHIDSICKACYFTLKEKATWPVDSD